MSEMRQGMNRIRTIEDRAPMLASLGADAKIKGAEKNG